MRERRRVEIKEWGRRRGKEERKKGEERENRGEQGGRTVIAGYSLYQVVYYVLRIPVLPYYSRLGSILSKDLL